MKRFRFLGLYVSALATSGLAALGMAGCVAGSVSQPFPDALTGSLAVPGGGLQPDAARHSDQRPEQLREPRAEGPAAGAMPDMNSLTTGTLSLAIRWPLRPAYRTLAIPESAQSIRIRVIGEDGKTELGSAFLLRPDGQGPISTASIELEAADNLQVEVKAYRQTSPSPGAVPVAQGLATGVSVKPSSETDVTLDLAPTSPPTLTGIAPPNGGKGAVITLTGTNFLTGSLVVKFAGILATVLDATDTRLAVLVPDGAVNGPIEVVADGLIATGSTTFRVLKTLGISPSSTSGVPVGTPVAFVLAGTDVSDQAVADASASLTFSSPDEAASASLQGTTFTPLTAGATWSLTARSGNLVATASIATD